MGPKTDMTAKLLLLAAAAYALLSLISLTGALHGAALQTPFPQVGGIEDAARDELKMVFSGEKLLLTRP